MNSSENVTLLHFATLDSTNRFALDTDEVHHLLTVVADSQTGGRGRLGRSFFSPKSGLYMSVVLNPENINCSLSLCTPAAAIAVSEALEKVGIEGLEIKWVNDLLLNGKKVCGILTEARTTNGKIDKIVVGIGINLLEPEGGFPEDISNKAGAVNYGGDKLKLAVDIAQRLDNYISSDSSAICDEYRKRLAFVGCEREITDYASGNEKIQGTLIGVNENCFLRIMTSQGEEKVISSGEIN